MMYLRFTTTTRYGLIHRYFLFHQLSYGRSVRASEVVRVVDGVSMSTTDSVSNTVLNMSLKTGRTSTYRRD